MNSFVATKHGRTYDNTHQGVLFPDNDRPGYLIGTFNSVALGKQVTLIARVDRDTHTYQLGLVDNNQLVLRGELRPNQDPQVHYTGALGDVEIIAFRAKKKGRSFLQIRPDLRRNLDAELARARDLFDQL